MKPAINMDDPHQAIASTLEDALEHATKRMHRLSIAVEKLYTAGHWSCDRDVDERALWTELRDAAGINPGNSPKPRKGAS